MWGDMGWGAEALLGVCRPADVEEVGRLSAVVFHQVHRGHREACAVHDATDVALELDEGQMRIARLHLTRLFGGFVAQRLELRATIQLVVLARSLCVGAPDVPRRRHARWIRLR